MPTASYRWVSDRVKLVLDASGKPKELVGCWIDITEQRRAEETIRNLAYFDGLTGLPNRVLMRELARARAGRRRAPSAQPRRAVRRSRSIQAHQRHARPRHGRPLASGSREAPGQLHSPQRRHLFRRRRRESASGRSRKQAISRLGGDEFVLILSEISSSEDAANVARRIARRHSPSQSAWGTTRSSSPPASASACILTTRPAPRRF